MDSTSLNPPDGESSREQLVLKNNLDELEPLGAWVQTLALRYGLSTRGSFRLELVLVEAVTNVIENAYDDQAAHTITLNCHHQGDTLTIQIQDDGYPFDPLRQPEVVLPKSLDEAVEGGLGIHLIRNYIDECHYERIDHYNCLTLVLHDRD
jgi:anti-sigma regulatory factor (Ser/Thr protein kinase)